MLALMGKYGRLGNQLWTYANVMAYALEVKLPIINVAFDSGGFFNGIKGARLSESEKEIIRENFALRKIARLVYKINLRLKFFPFVQIGESTLLNLDLENDYVKKLRRTPFVFLSGFYFFAPESLDRHANSIRSFFSLVPNLEEKVSEFILTSRIDCDVLVGIHIRQGDYRTYCGGVMYYSTEEYVLTMRVLAEQLPDKKVSFIICSDEEQNPDLFEGLRVHVSRNEAIVDMYILAKCDYILGPNSTFSHWASFYGKVPLHILDWKTAKASGYFSPVYNPGFKEDFCIYSPHQFAKYSEKKVSFDEFF